MDKMDKYDTTILEESSNIEDIAERKKNFAENINKFLGDSERFIIFVAKKTDVNKCAVYCSGSFGLVELELFSTVFKDTMLKYLSDILEAMLKKTDSDKRK